MLDKATIWLDWVILFLGVIFLLISPFAGGAEVETISGITVAALGVAIGSLGFSEINRRQERKYIRGVINAILIKLDADKDEAEKGESKGGVNKV